MMRFGNGLMCWDSDPASDGESIFSFSSSLSSSSSSSDEMSESFSFSDMSESDSSSASDMGDVIEIIAEEEERIYASLEDKNIEFGERYEIEHFNNSQCVSHFRFRKADLQELADTLWPRLEPYFIGPKDSLRLQNKYRAPYETCFLVFLYRLSYPHRIRPEMEEFFKMRKSQISSAILTFSEALYELSSRYFDDPGLWHHRMPYYANLVYLKVGLLDMIWGFIDGTIRRSCRPVYFQEAIYQMYIRGHGLKYQVVKTPDGFIALMFGPRSCKTHDSLLFTYSGLKEKLRCLMPADESNGKVYAVYADAAYAQSIWVVHGYINPVPGSLQAKFNSCMAKARIAVEWAFKNITQFWSFLDFKREMKIFKTPIGQFYMNGAFLTNCHNCFYGNQTGEHFGVPATDRLNLHQYLGLID
jgi:hypothetical protein